MSERNSKEIIPSGVVAQAMVESEGPVEPNNQGAPLDLQLENISVYEEAIAKFRLEIVDLVQRGSMTEQVASRIISENEYSFFQQLVSIKLNRK